MSIGNNDYSISILQELRKMNDKLDKLLEKEECQHLWAARFQQEIGRTIAVCGKCGKTKE